MANSYFAKYHARTGTMIGGVTKSQTSRFRDRKDAQQRLKDIIELNNENVVGTIVESDLPPEIFVHCGNIATTIGAKCPRCGKILRQSDAENAQGNFEIGEKVLAEVTVTHIYPETDQIIVTIEGKEVTLSSKDAYPHQ